MAQRTVVGCLGCGARHELEPERVRVLPQLACPACGGRLTRGAGATAQVVTPYTRTPAPGPPGPPKPAKPAKPARPQEVEPTADGTLGADGPPIEPLFARVGERIGRYELREAIGQGGFGMVYRAWDPQHQREVALKVLVQPGERAERRFTQEIRAAARLRHPNIVTLLDSGEAYGRPYLVMELVTGGNLAARCLDLTVRKRVEVVRDLSRALAYAHGEGVLHRDIKPDNVLLDVNGHPRLVDLGLARILGASTARLTQTGEAYGTPAYMAPEQAGYGKSGADERSDVYSLGATLYHTLTGCPPFDESGIALFLAMFREPPVPLRERDPSLPVALETICATCLEKRQEDRYASAAELADDLDRYLAGEPIAAQPSTLLLRAARWARAHQALLLGVAAGLVVGLGLGIGVAVTVAGTKSSSASAMPEPAGSKPPSTTPSNLAQLPPASAGAGSSQNARNERQAPPSASAVHDEVTRPTRSEQDSQEAASPPKAERKRRVATATPTPSTPTAGLQTRSDEESVGAGSTPSTPTAGLKKRSQDSPTPSAPTAVKRRSEQDSLGADPTPKAEGHLAGADTPTPSAPTPTPGTTTSAPPSSAPSAAPPTTAPSPSPRPRRPSVTRSPILVGVLLAIVAGLLAFGAKRRRDRSQAEEALARWQAGRHLNP